MKNCLFCKIIKGDIPSTKIYEDKRFLAFLDINPINRGHTLLIPKKHSRNIFDIDNQTLQRISLIIKKLSTAIKESLNVDGINIHINNEPAAGQVIFHTHIHIIPRLIDDNIKMWEGKKYKENEIEKIVKKIKEQLEKQADY